MVPVRLVRRDPRPRREILGCEVPLIGDWLDEGSDAVVKVNCRWSDDGNFLLRSFSVARRGKPVMSVSQRVGWDAAAKQVLRCFIVPRGVTVLAGGTVEPDATTFDISADAGSDTYGICSNKFLDREFKTVRYELTITVHGRDSFSYKEDTQLKLKGRQELFHHTDANTVKRVG